MRKYLGIIGSWLLFVLAAGVALQVFFLARIGMMTVVDPQSTSFMRSEAWRLGRSSIGEGTPMTWSAQWANYDEVSASLKRAVVAAEDARFTEHNGFEWNAMESAWRKNAKRMAQANAGAKNKPKTRPAQASVRLVGGSTISQQLAKNLFLSGERSYLRKGQEFVLTVMLEGLLSKERILEIYLNTAEWGEGVFGAKAAAQHYYKRSPGKLSSYQSAQLASMLPRPKFYDSRRDSVALSGKARRVQGRMGAAAIP
ncbi:monofunctional biosynthetic peptidoglycan transglycosylase [Hydrogenophaga sp. 5NK40-0174]|uniref:monofunctional biosynthetic peptidoglycan transglycosylase n=1 Tax=Hydrogenophaga sp. 5NK40-0174 TaxID=3127649 RepID=UPI00310458D1